MFASVGIEVQASRHALASPLACGADGRRRGKALGSEASLYIASGLVTPLSIIHIFARVFAALLARAVTQLSYTVEERRSEKDPLLIWLVDR